MNKIHNAAQGCGKGWAVALVLWRACLGGGAILKIEAAVSLPSIWKLVRKSWSRDLFRIFRVEVFLYLFHRNLVAQATSKRPFNFGTMKSEKIKPRFLVLIALFCYGWGLFFLTNLASLLNGRYWPAFKESGFDGEAAGVLWWNLGAPLAYIVIGFLFLRYLEGSKRVVLFSLFVLVISILGFWQMNHQFSFEGYQQLIDYRETAKNSIYCIRIMNEYPTFFMIHCLIVPIWALVILFRTLMNQRSKAR